MRGEVWYLGYLLKRGWWVYMLQCKILYIMIHHPALGV